MVPNFRTVPTVTGALRTILPPTFDPSRLAVVESYPGIEPTPDAKPGEATYREDAPEDVHIDVRATAPSIVVVRTSFDAGWQATVDGEPAEAVPVDGFLQGSRSPPVETTCASPTVTRPCLRAYEPGGSVDRARARRSRRVPRGTPACPSRQSVCEARWRSSASMN